MYHRPFPDQVQSPARQLALDDGQGSDVDRDFELTVSGVKVWRRVIIEEHSDQDPIESADCRHPARPILSPHGRTYSSVSVGGGVLCMDFVVKILKVSLGAGGGVNEVWPCRASNSSKNSLAGSRLCSLASSSPLANAFLFLSSGSHIEQALIGLCILHNRRGLSFTVRTTGRLLLLSCFRNSPERRRNVVSDWISFVISSIGPILEAFDYAPDFVLLDPPRAGLGKEVVRRLGELRPPRVTIVACDPATLARDLAGLTAAGYRVKQVTLVDLFPQTFHLEAVVRLGRTGSA